ITWTAPGKVSTIARRHSPARHGISQIELLSLVVNSEDQKKRSIRSTEHVGAAKSHSVCKHNPALSGMQGLNLIRLSILRFDLSRCPNKIRDNPTDGD